MSASETYLFVSNPQPVSNDRPKYRQPEREVQDDIARTSNLMWDARVVRGKTSGKPIQLMTSRFQFASEPYQKTAAAHRKENRERKERLVRRGLIRPSFPSVNQIHSALKVPKTRVPVPLELYLTEQKEKVQTHNLHSQTDAFVQEEEEIKRPVYIPRKTGVDIGTQVDHELVFQYDRDVKPIIQTVISKTVEQSLMEVLQEEEFDFMRKRMNTMIDKRKTQKQRRQEAEDRERAKRKEMEIKLRRARERVQRERDVRKKMASRIMAKRFLAKLESNVLENLTEKKFFYEPLADQVDAFIPWLYDKLRQKLEDNAAAQQTMQDLLLQSVQGLAQQKAQARERRLAAAKQREEKAKEREANAALRAKRKQRVELYIHCDGIAESPVGPLKLTGQSTVGDMQALVIEWLSDKMSEPPEPTAVKYLWNGKELVNKNVILYELGMETLSTIKLFIQRAQEPVPDSSDSPEDDSTTASVGSL